MQASGGFHVGLDDVLIMCDDSDMLDSFVQYTIHYFREVKGKEMM